MSARDMIVRFEQLECSIDENCSSINSRIFPKNAGPKQLTASIEDHGKIFSTIGLPGAAIFVVYEFSVPFESTVSLASIDIGFHRQSNSSLTSN